MKNTKVIPMYSVLNLDQVVKVKLTARGAGALRIWEGFDNVKFGDSVTMRLWEIMSYFGPGITHEGNSGMFIHGELEICPEHQADPMPDQREPVTRPKSRPAAKKKAYKPVNNPNCSDRNNAAFNAVAKALTDNGIGYVRAYREKRVRDDDSAVDGYSIKFYGLSVPKSLSVPKEARFTAFKNDLNKTLEVLGLELEQRFSVIHNNRVPSLHVVKKTDF